MKRLWIDMVASVMLRISTTRRGWRAPALPATE
jgi:hypothetical protein